MSTIRIDGVSKFFRDKPALDRIELDVNSGELIALLGSSGCGKTTLLRVIAGLTEPSAGRVLFDGRDMTDLPTRLRPIGMVFQSYSLFPNMSVRQNIAFPLTVRGQKTAAIARRVDELLHLIGLTDWADHHPNQLSGGQQQRTALARALAPDPAVLLLDEPLSALDAVVRLHLRDEIRRIQQSIKTTALLVTHDQSEALAVADRVAVLLNGRLVQVAAPDILYRRPIDTAVARFVGEAILLPGSAEGGRVACGFGSLALAEGAPEGAVEVMIRPEQIRLVRDAAGATAKVLGVTYYGHDATVRLAAPDGSGAVILARIPGYDLPRPGAEVGIAIDGPVMTYSVSSLKQHL